MIEIIDTEILTKEYLKVFYVDHIALSSDLKGMVISVKKISPELKEVASKLGIILLELMDLFGGLLKIDSYQQVFSDKEKNNNYFIPSLKGHSVSTDASYIIKTLEKKSQSLIFIEGRVGIGKTSFSNYLSSLLIENFSTSPEGLLPIYLDANFYHQYESFEDFVLKEGFLKNQIEIDSSKTIELLHKFKKTVYMIDNIDVLETKSYQSMKNLLKSILEYQNLGAQFVITTPRRFFHFKHEDSYYLKHTYEALLHKADIEYYEIEPFTLMDMKELIKKTSTKKLIDNNDFLRQVFKQPVFMSLLKDVEEDRLKAIYSYEELMSYFIDLWDCKYITHMGKELLLQTISQCILDKGTFSLLEDTPDYIENFIHLEYKSLDFSLKNLQKDVSKCLLLKEEKDKHYAFKHSYFMFYHIAKQLQEEVSVGQFKNIHFLSYEGVYPFLTSFFKDKYLLSIMKHLSNPQLDNFRKGKSFVLLHKILSYLNKTKNPISMKDHSLQNIVIPLSYLAFLNLENSSLENASLEESDLRFSLYKKVNFNTTFLSKSNYNSTLFDQCEFEGTSFKNSYGNKAQFKNSFFKNVQFFQTSLIEAQFENSIMEISNFQSVISVKSLWKEMNFQHTDFSHTDFYQSDFYLTKIENCITRSLNLSETLFQKSSLKNLDFILSYLSQFSFKEGSIEQVNFSQNKMYQSTFFHTSLENVSFINTDLRKSDFSLSKLQNVNFDGADLRGSNLLDTASSICSKTKESLKKAIF